MMATAKKKRTRAMKQHIREATLLADHKICAVCWHHALACYLSRTAHICIYNYIYIISCEQINEHIDFILFVGAGLMRSLCIALRMIADATSMKLMIPPFIRETQRRPND